MKAPEYKGPAPLSHNNYTENCKLVSLPKGYRFLRRGEKTRKEDFHTPFGEAKWKNNGETNVYGEAIIESMWPQIRKVDVVLNKEMVNWVAQLEVLSYLRSSAESLKSFLGGEKEGVMGFSWFSTENSQHWCDIYKGTVAPTEADKEYARLYVEAVEKRIAELTPKPAPRPKPAEPKVKIELLRAHIKVLEKENADLKAWKAKVLAAI